jgi:hypothetical protein
VPLLGCEWDILAGVWAAEKRRQRDGHVHEEEQLNCVDCVTCVRRVADELNGDAGRLSA